MYLVGGQAYGMNRGMWQGKGHMAGCGACDRVWGHMAGVVAGGGGMWQGVGVCGRGQASGMDGDMWQGWGHVAGCGGMW